MKKEEKIQPSAWHQHISNDSQAEKICGRWSKVANLWKAPFKGITKDKKTDKGIKKKDTNKRQNKENKKNDSQTAHVGSLVMMLVLHVWPTCQRHLLWYFDTVEILTIDLGKNGDFNQPVCTDNARLQVPWSRQSHKIHCVHKNERQLKHSKFLLYLCV